MQPSSDRYSLVRFLIAAAVLAGTVAVAAAERGSLSTIRPVLWVAAIALSITAASTMWLRRRPVGRLFHYAQFALDVGIASALCAYTNGLHSAFIVLYFPAIGGAAFVLGMRGAVVTAGLAVVGLVVVIALTEGVPAPGLRLQLYTDGMFRAFAFLLMAVLTGQLAERAERTGRELQEVRRTTELLEEEHEKVLMLVPAAVLTTDAQGRVLGQNPAALAMFGDVSGTPVAEVLSEEPPGGLERRWEAEGPGGRRVLFSSARLPDGGRVVLAEDISELHRMRQETARHERLVAMGGMAAGVAHEIRNPLASLSGALQLLAEDPDPELARIAVEEARRINRLVDEFLALARPAALRREEVDLAALVHEVVRAFGQDPRHRDRVRVEVTAAPVSLVSDPDRLRQMLWNLLLNGAQAMPGGGTIDVEVRPELGPEGTPGVALRVRDRGVGIPAEERARIFEPFHTTRPGGLGVGLMVVDQVVRAHSGRIEVSAPEDGGTAFRIWLPREVPLGQ